MRFWFVILVGLYGAFAFADRQSMLTCNTHMFGENSSAMSIQIFQEGANVTASIQDDEVTTDGPVEVTEAGVREGLTPEMLDQNLNIAEHLVAFAMATEAEPAAKGVNAGLDLKAVRSAKVYDVDPKRFDPAHAAIVDAKDASGKSLGRFLSGLIVGPCK